MMIAENICLGPVLFLASLDVVQVRPVHESILPYLAPIKCASVTKCVFPHPSLPSARLASADDVGFAAHEPCKISCAARRCVLVH